MKQRLLRNQPRSDAATSRDFLHERLQRAFTRANQLHWTAHYETWRIRLLEVTAWTDLNHLKPNSGSQTTWPNHLLSYHLFYDSWRWGRENLVFVYLIKQVNLPSSACTTVPLKINPLFWTVTRKWYILAVTFSASLPKWSSGSVLTGTVAQTEEGKLCLVKGTDIPWLLQTRVSCIMSKGFFTPASTAECFIPKIRESACKSHENYKIKYQKSGKALL